MTQLTLRDVLAVPVVRAADPGVVAGHARLGRAVRWVHAAEIADVALRGGDLVLTTGAGLPGGEDALVGFVAGLADADAAGLMVELGRRWRDALPDALVGACERHGLPLLVLRRETGFAAIIQAVGERIVDEQLAELRDAERVHETFTELSLAQAGPRDILATVQRLSGAAVVLESARHQVLDYVAGPEDVADLLRDWSARSRAVRPADRTHWDRANGWLVTRLGPRDREWGRLVVHAPAPPGHTLVTIAERAAAALALHRLHDRNRDHHLRRAHHELLTGLLADPTVPDLLRRCELAGFPLVRRRFVGLVVRPGAGRPLEDVLAATVHALHDQDAAALVSEMDREVRALVSVPASAPADAVVDRLAARIAARHRVVIAAGRAVDAAARVDRTLREARQVADAVRPGAGGPVVHRLEDVHLRGLLTLLADDDRLRLFVSRELDPLRAHDAAHGDNLLTVLRALLQHPGSKSEAAAGIPMSRPAFYARLARIESTLGASLDDPDLRVSLHVALLADELRRARGTA
ncbi:PucR family transcriptional regulator [Actinomadura atramentaria]|uniref:PucR family transcriptional regulator n=1 Tax=Actinomadura atramentaria TaxID=1990 RepID=UPI0003619A2D|nr:PucR family transcriptional regulator [Actinomadura atramentaria]